MIVVEMRVGGIIMSGINKTDLSRPLVYRNDGRHETAQYQVIKRGDIIDIS